MGGFGAADTLQEGDHGFASFEHFVLDASPTGDALVAWVDHNDDVVRAAVRDQDRVYATILDCTLRHDPRPGCFRPSRSAELRQRTAAASLRAAGATLYEWPAAGVGPAAVALVVESETSDAIADDGPVSLDAAGVADEPALAGEGVIIGDPAEESLLDVPEVESDEMPDSDVEE